jgi:hypothetical protein
MKKIILIAITLIAILSSCKKEEVVPEHDLLLKIEMYNPTFSEPVVTNFSVGGAYVGNYDLNLEPGDEWVYEGKIAEGGTVDFGVAASCYFKWKMTVFIDGVEVSYKICSTSETDYCGDFVLIESESDYDLRFPDGSDIEFTYNP